MKKQKKWWQEKDKYENSTVIGFTLISKHRTGLEWLNYFKKSKHSMSDDFTGVEELLESKHFKISPYVTKFEIAVLNNEVVPSFYPRPLINTIIEEGGRRNWKQPSMEIACLIREKFTNKEIQEMGLWSIFVLHPPYFDFEELPHYLCINRHWKQCDVGVLGDTDSWHRIGFPFIVSKK